jgi:hypothetical protein
MVQPAERQISTDVILDGIGQIDGTETHGPRPFVEI